MTLNPLECAVLWPAYRGKHRIALAYGRRLPPFCGVAELPYGRFRVDTQFSEDRALLFGGMEQRELDWIRRQPVCDVAFDIGAHHGIYTVVLAHVAKRVVAVEPFPESADFAEANVELNDIAAVVVRKAASADGAPAMLHLSGDGPQNHSLVDALRPTGETVAVETTTVDHLAEEHGVPGLVKIDVERGELEVFEGARRVLEQRRTTFLFESLDWDARRDLVHALLRGHGYRLSSLVRGRERAHTHGPLLIARP